MKTISGFPIEQIVTRTKDEWIERMVFNEKHYMITLSTDIN